MKNAALFTVLTLASFLAINAQDLSKTSICKTWYLHHYKYIWKKYTPKAEEENDYIRFENDMSYVSVDEGEKSSGKWSFNSKEKYILMYDQEGKSIKLKVKELNSREFVFEIEDDEMKGLEIHYSSERN